jgi:hypothetical protein
MLIEALLQLVEEFGVLAVVKVVEPPIELEGRSSTGPRREAPMVGFCRGSL